METKKTTRRRSGKRAAALPNALETPNAATDTSAIAIEVQDEEFDDSAFAALLATLDAGLRQTPTTGEELTPTYQAVKTVAEHLQLEARSRDGVWTKWTDVADGEVLVASIVYAMQEERKLIAQYRAKRKSAEAAAPIPVAVELALQARARFGRAIKGWRGAAFEGFPWNFDNFLQLWTESVAFRGFLNGEALAVRARVEQELAEQGKG